jgi:hypothetical protein
MRIPSLRTVHVRFPSFVAVFVLAFTCTTSAPAWAAVEVVPPHSTVEGKTIGEWSAESWKWAFSFQRPDDPFSNPSGANQHLHQSGPVFYLARNAAESAFSVPQGKYILALLEGYVASEKEDGFGRTEPQLRAIADAFTDQVHMLSATVDGVAVPNLFAYRELSPVFNYTVLPNNPVGFAPGESGMAVSDGYYLLFAPPSPGEHVIEIGSQHASGPVYIDRYTITVTPEPSALFLAGLCGSLLLRRGTWRH